VKIQIHALRSRFTLTLHVHVALPYKWNTGLSQSSYRMMSHIRLLRVLPKLWRFKAGIPYGNQSFKASNGWFNRFKKRHNLSFRRSTHIAQHSKELTNDRVDKFLRFVIKLRCRRSYDMGEIGNMDETRIWLEMPGKSTYAT